MTALRSSVRKSVPVEPSFTRRSRSLVVAGFAWISLGLSVLVASFSPLAALNRIPEFDCEVHKV